MQRSIYSFEDDQHNVLEPLRYFLNEIYSAPANGIVRVDSLFAVATKSVDDCLAPVLLYKGEFQVQRNQSGMAILVDMSRPGRMHRYGWFRVQSKGDFEIVQEQETAELRSDIVLPEKCVGPCVRSTVEWGGRRGVALIYPPRLVNDRCWGFGGEM